MTLMFEGYSTFEEVSRIVNEAIDSISALPELSEGKTLFKISVGLRELLNNAVEHGNVMDSNKRIALRLTCDEGMLEFIVEDEGPGFCHKKILKKVSQESPKRARMRGVALVEGLGFSLATDTGRVTARFYIDKKGNEGDSYED